MAPPGILNVEQIFDYMRMHNVVMMQVRWGWKNHYYVTGLYIFRLTVLVSSSARDTLGRAHEKVHSGVLKQCAVHLQKGASALWALMQ